MSRSINPYSAILNANCIPSSYCSLTSLISASSQCWTHSTEKSNIASILLQLKLGCTAKRQPEISIEKVAGPDTGNESGLGNIEEWYQLGMICTIGCYSYYLSSLLFWT